MSLLYFLTSIYFFWHKSKVCMCVVKSSERFIKIFINKACNSWTIFCLIYFVNKLLYSSIVSNPFPCNFIERFIVMINIYLANIIYQYSFIFKGLNPFLKLEMIGSIAYLRALITSSFLVLDCTFSCKKSRLRFHPHDICKTVCWVVFTFFW